QKTAGGGPTTIGLRFNNTGTVDIQSGTVNFTCGGGSPGNFLLPPPGPRPPWGGLSSAVSITPNDLLSVLRSPTEAGDSLNRAIPSIAEEDVQSRRSRRDSARDHPVARVEGDSAPGFLLDETTPKPHRLKADSPLDAQALTVYLQLFNCGQQSL